MAEANLTRVFFNDGGWVNLQGNLVGARKPKKGKQKTRINLGYNLIQKRWRRCKEYQILAEHYPEVLEQLLAEQHAWADYV